VKGVPEVLWWSVAGVLGSVDCRFRAVCEGAAGLKLFLCLSTRHNASVRLLGWISSLSTLGGGPGNGPTFSIREKERPRKLSRSYGAAEVSVHCDRSFRRTVSVVARRHLPGYMAVTLLRPSGLRHWPQDSWTIAAIHPVPAGRGFSRSRHDWRPSTKVRNQPLEGIRGLWSGLGERTRLGGRV
jgi:hypothetical protein